jgi:hypothetical protein
VADILFLLAHGAAKASVILLLSRLHREATYRKFCHGILVLTLCWLLASVLLVAIKCNPSPPWLLDGECKDVVSLSMSFYCTQTTTSNAHLIVPPLAGDHSPRYSLRSYDVPHEYISYLGSPNAMVWEGCGGWRLWKSSAVSSHPVEVWFRQWTDLIHLYRVIVIAIVRLIYLNSVDRSSDPTLAGVDANICTQILLHYSLMAATIPCLKPFVISFNTGWGLGMASKSQSSNPQLYSENSGSPPAPAPAPAPVQEVVMSPPPFRQDLPEPQACVTNVEVGDHRHDGADSIHSHESQRMIIHETRAWMVEHESIEMKSLGSDRT